LLEGRSQGTKRGKQFMNVLPYQRQDLLVGVKAMSSDKKNGWLIGIDNDSEGKRKGEPRLTPPSCQNDMWLPVQS